MSLFANTPDPVVSIIGWRAAGPVVVVQEYQTGFSNRRNRWKATREDAKGRGRDVQHAAHALGHRAEELGYDVVAFNKGYYYLVRVVVDGRLDAPYNIQVDAIDDYATLKIADGVDIIDVSSFENDVAATGALLAELSAPTAEDLPAGESDDEDVAGEAAGSGSDEEE